MTASLSPDTHHTAARALFDAEKTRRQIDLISKAHPDITMDDAYAIQKALSDLKQADGLDVIGWKIGLTSKAMQYALNIDIPDSGILFDNMLFPNGGTVPADRFIQPRIEAEIAFVMKAPIGGETVSRADILAAADYVAPALEILDTRIHRIDPETGKTRTVYDTISDNAANAGLVLGAGNHPVDAFDLRWVGVMTFRNGEIEETGLGAGVLNDPVESLVWLARRMAQYGQQIEPGQIILSGNFIRPVECPPGSNIHADFGPFGTVDISFAST